MTDHVLDLSVLERDTVKLADGTTVALRNPEELGPLDEYRLHGLMKAVANADASKFKSEADAEDASEKMHALAATIAIDLPAEVDDGSCAAIFAAWIGKHGTNPPKPPRRRPQDRKPKSPTGATSSRASKRSTAATR